MQAAQVEEGGQGAGQASKLALTQRTRSPRQRRGSWGGEGALVLSTSPASRRDRRNSESSGTGVCVVVVWCVGRERVLFFAV
eukprot:2923074-Rhodomonas_salina.2